MNKKTQRTSGLTLIEVLIATFLLSLIIGYFTKTMVGNLRLRSILRAKEAMASEMDTIMRSYVAGHLLPRIKARKCSLNPKKDLSYQIIGPITDPSTGARAMNIQVTPWHSGPDFFTKDQYLAAKQVCSKGPVIDSTPNTSKITSCVRLSNLRALNQATNGQINAAPAQTVYAKIDLNFKHLRGSSFAANPICAMYLSEQIDSMFAEVHYWVYALVGHGGSRKLTYYTNTIKFH